MDTNTNTLSECSAIVLAKCAYAETMTRAALVARKRCTITVLKLAAQMRRVGLGHETLHRLSSRGLIEWRRIGGWQPTEAGIAALSAHIGGPVFES